MQLHFMRPGVVAHCYQIILVTSTQHDEINGLIVLY